VLLNHTAADGTVGPVPIPRAGELTLTDRPDVARRSARVWLSRTLVGLVAWEALAAGLIGGLALLGRSNVTLGTPLLLVAVALVPAWPAALGIAGAYSVRHIGTGSDEFRAVLRAGVMLFALVGFTSYAGMLELSRGLVVLGIPGLVLGTLLGRFAVRHRLRRLWTRGSALRRVLLVGRGHAVVDLAAQLKRERFAGLEVVAACVTEGDRDRVQRSRGIPVGGLDDVLAMAARHDVDTIAVTSSSETAADYLRRLSWQLEGTDLELLVAPGLVEVAGPRLHIRPLEGLPLLVVEQPRFEGWPRLVKGAVDRTFAGLALLLLAPVLLTVALAVRLSSPGPVFYRQERIGLGGRPFTLLKFRSMVVDADARRAEFTADNISDGLLFKIRNDPRVTPVGRWLRRYSLDELPQLLNVLQGSMSLVGPRPPLPGEVAHYDSSVSRRLLVKPGLTGLWQISGRSDLPWEEAVRLDLRYVENWSLALDALILWKTGRAVLTSSGAY
jgi:exopolysaccharide biosynthesis polyprenyl glycosylphosphotransferase